MLTRVLIRLFAFLIPLALLGADRCHPPPEEEEYTWYTTCGDPVCQGYTGPFDGVPLCDDEAEGAQCSRLGATCDPENDCNALLQCAAEDPKDQTGGCPISRRRHKTAVQYLDEGARKTAAEQVWSTRLAEWRYTWDAPDRRPHLGFLIDDQETSPAVAADGEHVDLYGYTSLTVAALQEEHAARLRLEERVTAQDAAIRALQAEIEALKR